MPVRLKDIARDLGVSTVTVSKVLLNHRDIGPETRERVLKRIKELNYQPNPAARALAAGQTRLVGLVVPDLVHPFFAQVAKGAAHALRKAGYGLIIASSEEDPHLEQEEIEQMIARQVDALMVASTQPSHEVFEKITKPFVLVDRRFNGLATNFVGIDDVKAGMLATQHLIENGRRSIAYIGGRFVSTAVGRREGYRQALRENGFTVFEKYMVCKPHYDDSAEVSGYRAMKQLLRLKRLPDAVFCGNDYLAMGAMTAIFEAGLRVPQDFAIVGCGNTLYAPALRVPLTSVDQSSESLGERTAKLALGLIGKKDKPVPATVLLESRLIVRDSSGAKS
jgi:LacI family transcriptional regulator